MTGSGTAAHPRGTMAGMLPAWVTNGTAEGTEPEGVGQGAAGCGQSGHKAAVLGTIPTALGVFPGCNPDAQHPADQCQLPGAGEAGAR